MKKLIGLPLAACGALLLLLGTAAQAQVVVYVGYYDLAPGLPSPWAGSPNTTFLGDLPTANAADPDEGAIRLQNTGASAVTLNQGVVIDVGTTYQLWDSLIGASGLTIPPGGNVILSGTTSSNGDLSDVSFSKNPVISVSINGTLYQFTDTTQILKGGPSANESKPWTQIGVTGSSAPPASAPALSDWGLVALAIMLILAAAVMVGRERQNQVQTEPRP